MHDRILGVQEMHVSERPLFAVFLPEVVNSIREEPFNRIANRALSTRVFAEDGDAPIAASEIDGERISGSSKAGDRNRPELNHWRPRSYASLRALEEASCG